MFMTAGLSFVRIHLLHILSCWLLRIDPWQLVVTSISILNTKRLTFRQKGLHIKLV